MVDQNILDPCPICGSSLKIYTQTDHPVRPGGLPSYDKPGYVTSQRTYTCGLEVYRSTYPTVPSPVIHAGCQEGSKRLFVLLEEGIIANLDDMEGTVRADVELAPKELDT